jgi:hypothetical protein
MGGVYVYFMFIVTLQSSFNRLADNPDAAIMRAYLANRRLGLVKLSQGVAARVEEKTGFTNYSAHVFDAAIYYNKGIKNFSELESLGVMESMSLTHKRYMQHILHVAAKESAYSAFRAANAYRSGNVRTYKWIKRIKAITSALGL